MTQRFVYLLVQDEQTADLVLFLITRGLHPATQRVVNTQQNALPQRRKWYTQAVCACTPGRIFRPKGPLRQRHLSMLCPDTSRATSAPPISTVVCGKRPQIPGGKPLSCGPAFSLSCPTCSARIAPPPPPRDALEGKGPHRRPQQRLDRRLEEVAKAVEGGYCRLQMPLKLALGVRGTVAGHRLGALEGGGGYLPPFQCIPAPPPPTSGEALERGVCPPPHPLCLPGHNCQFQRHL